MKRWLPWLSLPLIVSVVVFFSRSSSPSLLKDTDTATMIAAIESRHSPISWFGGDWPLQNHFYRPISALSFEADLAVYGHNAWGFGLTNALLAIACILLTFSCVYELTQKPWLAGLSSAMFGLWHVLTPIPGFVSGLFWILSFLPLLGIRSGLKKLPSIASSIFVFLFCTQLSQPVFQFIGRIEPWIPGRTASIMTVFALATIALFARYQRILMPGEQKQKPMTAFEIPSTKGTIVTGPPSRTFKPLALAGIFFGTLLALGSYEQAVTIPFLLLLVYLSLMFLNRKTCPLPLAASFLALAIYVIVRLNVVPIQPSGYQLQQFRNGAGVGMSLLEYALPGCNWLFALIPVMEGGILMLLFPAPWVYFSLGVSNFVAAWRVWLSPQKWSLILYFAMSTVSYLPMAFLQQFGHYHYLPSVFRSVFGLLMFQLGFSLLASAISLPEMQAPKRSCPAKGSLPHQ